MKDHFKLDEFHKKEINLPEDVKDKIEKYHIPVLNELREKLGHRIIISRHSGYRPVWYELEHGRSGKSQHTFCYHGAVDLTCDSAHLEELWKLLKKSAYTRICLYVKNNFIHCDFKPVEKKQAFLCMDGKNWEFSGFRSP